MTSRRPARPGHATHVGQAAADGIADERASVGGWGHLTWLEQLAGGAVFVLVFLGIEALGVPGVSARPWLVGPALAAAYTGVARWYAARVRPWRAPRWFRDRTTVHALQRALSRTVAWWMVSGRRGLLVSCVGLAFVAGGLSAARSAKELVSDLHTQGRLTSAVVSSIDHDEKGRRSAVKVAFVAAGARKVEPLRILGTVPSDLAVGEVLAVIFDPADPSKVLLPAQMNDTNVKVDYVVASLGGAAAIGGLMWWLVRRRTPVTSRRHRAGLSDGVERGAAQ